MERKNLVQELSDSGKSMVRVACLKNCHAGERK